RSAFIWLSSPRQSACANAWRDRACTARAFRDSRHQRIFPSHSEGNAMLDPDGGLLRGTLDLLILKALSWGPRHGYAVAEWIKQATADEVLAEEGPLYTALHRLERKGWLSADWGYSENNRKAKYYQLSRAGRQQLRSEVSSWERYVRAVTKALAA